MTSALFRHIQAISVVIYRGAQCPTLKTASKQPKRVPSRNSQNSCFSGVSAVLPAVLPWLTRHLFRLVSGFFQCRAFGRSVEGRRDGKACSSSCRQSWTFEWEIDFYPAQVLGGVAFSLYLEEDKRATTNMQNGLVFVFLFSLKNFWGKRCENVWKMWKSAETILPFSCCPLVFPI